MSCATLARFRLVLLLNILVLTKILSHSAYVKRSHYRNLLPTSFITTSNTALEFIPPGHLLKKMLLH